MQQPICTRVHSQRAYNNVRQFKSSNSSRSRAYAASSPLTSHAHVHVLKLMQALHARAQQTVICLQLQSRASATFHARSRSCSENALRAMRARSMPRSASNCNCEHQRISSRCFNMLAVVYESCSYIASTSLDE